MRLVAVCDLKPENALNAASEAEELLGVRPEVYSDLDAMFAQEKHIDAVDIVTEPSVHHILACIAFEAGAHVMV
ncbi:MAG: Gfo/Idh/MocA family oxidoreductase, partial [Candidatus Marinimicrobia bacterium]|nr:Gfo/Idh/MocA family oxidoreductase [Candidatus Neomarinimicrobiota bacterium]